MISSPCFPSSCLPSFCGSFCNSHHHLFILSPIIPSSWLSSGILSPCILFPNIPLSCLRSSLRLVSLIILFFTILYPVIPPPIIPASPTTESSWFESLEAGGRFSHHPFISSVFIFYPFILSPFIWSLVVLSPHHPFILSSFMLSAFIFSPTIISLSCPPLPSSYFPASLHVVSAFPPICFSQSSFIAVISLFCLLSPLHLVSVPAASHWFVVPYLLSLSLSFPMLFILSPIILSLPVRFLTMFWVWWEVIFWLCCCWVAQLG